MATCKDCLHLPVCNNVYFNLDILRQRYCGMYLPFGKQPSWIPVSERLPEDEYAVLVTCGKGYRPFIARYDHVWKRWKVSHTLRITHWMPLPEPPGEVSNGQA